jgi:hypothetical protein
MYLGFPRAFGGTPEAFLRIFVMRKRIVIRSEAKELSCFCNWPPSKSD